MDVCSVTPRTTPPAILSDPGFEVWMAWWNDVMDEDKDAGEQMMWHYIGPIVNKIMKGTTWVA